MVLTAYGEAEGRDDIGLRDERGRGIVRILLLVEDAAISRALEARIEQLMAGSERVDPADPAWQRTARRREWMRHWPGVLSV